MQNDVQNVNDEFGYESVCREQALAASRLAYAVIVQAAKDLMLPTEIHPDMSKDMKRKIANNCWHKSMAEKWVTNRNGIANMSLSDCCDYINMALSIEWGPGTIFIKPENLRDVMLKHPKRFVVSTKTIKKSVSSQQGDRRSFCNSFGPAVAGDAMTLLVG